MRGHTVDTESVAQDQIRAFVERIMRMREEARAINDHIREIYAEAKGNGFDKTVLGKIVLYVERRSKDEAGVLEAQALFDLYLAAVDGPKMIEGRSGTANALTHTHETKSEPAPAADPTGKGLNPLSPSEEAPLPVTTVGMGQPDAPSVADAAEQSESGGGENVDHQSATTGEAGAASPAPKRDRDHCLNPSACGAMGSRNHCHGCETAHLRKLESIDA